MAVTDPIEHVVVLMLENRSFDHMLGGLGFADPAGATASPNRINKDRAGNNYPQTSGAARVIHADPKHELSHVLHQLDDHNGGFVDDFAIAFPASSLSDRAEIMKYHDSGSLPALHFLAQNYTTCTRWHASVPGPTWTNRFFVHSGTALGRVEMPEGLMDANLHWYDQTTLYDRLNERNKTWRIYYGDIPQSLMLVHQLEPQNAKNYAKLNQFYQDVAHATDDPTSFPAYSFIEPAYYQPGACDDHPPHDVMEGQKLIAEVYNALRQNDDLWQKTLLVVLYDEHGGFYDHIEPPAATPPDHYVTEYSFDRLGVRVPAILISPFVKKGVCETLFDHTSLLRYLSDKWDLGPLGARCQAANSIAAVIGQTMRSDMPSLAPLPDVPLPNNLVPASRTTLSGGQSALVAMTQLLESMSTVGGNDLLSRMKRLVTGADGIVDVAIERVEDFLGQQKAASSKG